MIDREYCLTMARYNRWMNERIYERCTEIPEADRRRDLGAFFGSIHGTLNHLLWGDGVWMSRFTDRPRPEGGAADEQFSDFRALRTAREALDGEILAWAEGVDAAWLRGEVSWTSGIDGATRSRPAWILAAHVFNHQTHHRGQVTTLMMQLGYDPGVTDLPWMPGLEQGVG
ncbi:DinB family protein [Thiohalorhabdus sp. Cl-TMA]|uniref:DinB family protein n=1 Tax=Thiohalorhabdus methylotrophus TaxID=3242694 RepID=A0ABV4TZ98_9GAMM